MVEPNQGFNSDGRIAALCVHETQWKHWFGKSKKILAAGCALIVMEKNVVALFLR